MKYSIHKNVKLLNTKMFGGLGNASARGIHSLQKWCSFINRGFWMPARRALCLVTNSLGSGLSCKMEHTTWSIPMKSLSSAQEKGRSNKVCCGLALAASLAVFA